MTTNMPSAASELFLKRVSALDPKNTLFATQWIDALLASAKELAASDLHLQPTQDGCELRWRIDGVLHLVASWPKEVASHLVARLKVLAGLLTYRNDIPQEGRIPPGQDGIEMRLCTFPVAFGEKAVVRLFASQQKLLRLEELGLPDTVTSAVRAVLHETSGAFLATGPAGSGKTTTLYACLRELAMQSGGGRSLCSLEDPIETIVPGVAQSQVNHKAGFDLANGLRSLMRQDPEVILVGEIRDEATARCALEAALTGHLVLSSFHAGSAAGALSRFLDMGIEPYVLRSGILAILSQRLVRRLCECAIPSDDEAGKLGLNVKTYRLPAGCPLCHRTGYRGRQVLGELLDPSDERLGQAVLQRCELSTLERLARETGMTPLFQAATMAVEKGVTSPAEIRRVFGLLAAN